MTAEYEYWVEDGKIWFTVVENGFMECYKKVNNTGKDLTKFLGAYRPSIKVVEFHRKDDPRDLFVMVGTIGYYENMAPMEFEIPLAKILYYLDLWGWVAPKMVGARK